jgi:hypothetical protein
MLSAKANEASRREESKACSAKGSSFPGLYLLLREHQSSRVESSGDGGGGGGDRNVFFSSSSPPSCPAVSFFPHNEFA